MVGHLYDVRLPSHKTDHKTGSKHSPSINENLFTKGEGTTGLVHVVLILIFGKRKEVTADYCYSVIKFIARKNQFGDITPGNYEYAVSLAQNGIYDYFIGQLEQQRYDKPVPKVGVGMNDKVSNFLLPVKVTNELLTAASLGVFNYPATFNYLSLMTTTAFKTVPILDDTKFTARYNSSIDPVADSTGFGRKTTTGWLIYPTTVSQLYCSYYFRPPNTVWGYTVNSNGRPVYNPATSIDPVFDDVVMTKVIGRACKILGISFKEEFLVEYGKEVQMVGE